MANQVLKEEGRSMSEFLRDAICPYMDEREWLRPKRRERAEAHDNEGPASGGRNADG